MSILSDLNPQALAVKALVGVVVIGATFAGGLYVGYRHEKLVYDNFVLSQKSAAEQQKIANQSALQKLQSDYDKRANDLQQEYAQNAQNLQASRDAALADSAAYAGRLRQYLAGSHVRPELPGFASGPAGTAAGAQGSSGLLDGVSSLNWYLTQRFGQADSNAIALNEAIDLLDEDRRVCNGALPGVTGAPQQ
jgi:hypothetical protein